MTLEEAKQRFPKMWVIYDHPRDYPDHFVARACYGEVQDPEAFIKSGSLTCVREQVVLDGMCARLERHPNDDPCILEVWL